MSDAGVVPDAGKLILIRPEKQTQSLIAMSSSGSPVITDHADSSMTSVNVPAVAAIFEIVSVTAVGVGE